MRSWADPILVLHHILLTLVSLAVSQPDFLYHFCVQTGGNSTTTYRNNLETLLPSLSSNIDNYGFYSSTTGNNSDKAYAIVLCRGDVQLDLCRSCINNSTRKLPQLCSNYMEAIGWYDYCMLRYSNKSMKGILSDTQIFYMWNKENISSGADEFNRTLANLFDSLREEAASGGNRRKFATKIATVPDFSRNIYGLMQCTPDLSRQDCNNCLVMATAMRQDCCIGKPGGRVIGPSCNFRFETYLFFNDTPVVTPPPVDAPSVDVSPSPPVMLIFGILILRKRKQRKLMERLGTLDEAISTDEISVPESLQYDFDTLYIATDNFSDSNKLGRGGFGVVYKGKLPNGQEIAVKRLSLNSGQGEVEFKNEVMLVAKLQHRNLVRLLGFCLQDRERLLVYEFVINSSLDHFLFDPVNRANLDWERRYKIIGGIARGLLYLHEDSRLRIIHRDLKAGNILLDAELNPKISDFGMARLFMMDETQGYTSKIAGTYGYMSPEYAMHGQFSIKSDVYSFGVLVLEIISGQKNIRFQNGENEEDLLSYAWKSWRNRTISDLIDPVLRYGSSPMSEIKRCIHIGLLCIQDNVADRPTMASIVFMLNSFSHTLPIPSEPEFFRQHNSYNQDMPLLRGYNSEAIESNNSKSISIHASINETSITELYPR
ncbi:cysteine-rich receptor-like protein kinase 44 isoform X2 [Diospyros lotus]|uniref:cysteine-rich receptor-like protein kinase 44 isoform X2 n=1 Tax=Diospyros lotus TaxID=55363 RepID=UPI00224CE17F|nr:cysteine-rich receptor-like protein kinase 44 isoform X2 [Diospyros lotus]